MNKKLIGIFLFIFYATAIFMFFTTKFKRRAYEFSGKIENIKYDVKGIPTLIVNGKIYYLPLINNFKQNVEVGDSAIKKSDKLELKIIKKVNGKIFNFNL